MPSDHPTDPTASPPPRREDEPSGSLVAVIDDPRTADEALRAVSEFSAGVPYVLSPDEVLAQDAARAEASGPAQRAWRFLGGLGVHQGSLQERYVAHARAGGCVVVAAAADEQQADAIWASLRPFGAHDGVHVQEWTLRELV